MRFTLMLFMGTILVAQLNAASKEKAKDVLVTKGKITEEEKLFIKQVERHFAIAASSTESPAKSDELKSTTQLPAVIAIEIVNDTNTEGKEKRTIDANLGYGYKTNHGYTYAYFGKPKQEQGKFMIYPYSQEDIIPKNHGRRQYAPVQTKVDIQPSKAFELVPVHEEETSYHLKKPVQDIKSQYEHIKSQESPPPLGTGQVSQYYSVNESPEQHTKVPSTLFTTYEGGRLSALSGQFPSVMSNYLVDTNQLIQHPQYQNVGITSAHIQPNMAVEQRVIPVLILRIPSSHLKNPTAELYPNLPSNYPLSHYLNNVNLQQLLSQYIQQTNYPSAHEYLTQQASQGHPQQEAPQYHEAPQTHAEQPQQYIYTGSYQQPQYEEQVQYVTPETTDTEEHQLRNEKVINYRRPPYSYKTQIRPQHENPSQTIGKQKYYQHIQSHKSEQQKPPRYESESQSQLPHGFKYVYEVQEPGSLSSETLQQTYTYSHVPLEQNSAELNHDNSLKEVASGESLPLSENYPSEDHTRVVLPNKKLNKLYSGHLSATQAYAYVTPSPHANKYHTFNTMAKQNVVMSNPAGAQYHQFVYQTIPNPESDYQTPHETRYYTMSQVYQAQPKRSPSKRKPKLRAKKENVKEESPVTSKQLK